MVQSAKTLPPREKRAKPPPPSEAMRMGSHFVCRVAGVVCLTVATMVPVVRVAAAPAPEVLMQRYKCYVCHSDHEPKTGPPYVDVAAKYRGDPQAVSIVAGVVKNGTHGSGPWHMPPHPEVSDADAKKIARYILSLWPRTMEKRD